MSLQTALHFIEQARRDRTIRQAIKALGDEVTWEDLVRVAAAAGFDFTADELQRAYKHDWSMRWMRYGHRDDRR